MIMGMKVFLLVLSLADGTQREVGRSDQTDLVTCADRLAGVVASARNADETYGQAYSRAFADAARGRVVNVRDDIWLTCQEKQR